MFLLSQHGSCSLRVPGFLRTKFVFDNVMCTLDVVLVDPSHRRPQIPRMLIQTPAVVKESPFKRFLVIAVEDLPN